MQKIPNTFKGAYLEAPGKPLIQKQLNTPTLEKEGQILVKVEAAPINPADVLYTLGLYASPKPYPCVPGLEGAGIVVAGKGVQAQALIGKRVGFSSATDSFAGSWGEYALSTVTSAYPVPTNVAPEVAASGVVNPYTVVAMLETVKAAGVKTVVHTAAASQLGRMMVRYFQNRNVNVINVVRKPEQVEILKKIGAKHILNQNDVDFSEQLEKLSKELGATIAFEAIAGEMTGKIVAALPNNSTTYLYGALSGGNPTDIGIGDLIFKGKKLEGFWFPVEFSQLSEEKQAELVKEISKLLNTDFKTEVQKTFTYDQANDAIAFYQQNMSGGKVVLKP